MTDKVCGNNITKKTNKQQQNKILFQEVTSYLDPDRADRGGQGWTAGVWVHFAFFFFFLNTSWKKMPITSRKKMKNKWTIQKFHSMKKKKKKKWIHRKFLWNNRQSPLKNNEQKIGPPGKLNLWKKVKKKTTKLAYWCANKTMAEKHCCTTGAVQQCKQFNNFYHPNEIKIFLRCGILEWSFFFFFFENLK